MSTRPEEIERPREQRRRRVVAGEQERHHLVANLGAIDVVALQYRQQRRKLVAAVRPAIQSIIDDFWKRKSINNNK